MDNLILQLFNEGFLQTGENDGKSIYHLTTPCRFNISQSVVKKIRESYLSDEEIGGIFWAMPTISNDEKVFVIEEVSFIRNAIEDTPVYKDGSLRTKKDTYLYDLKIHEEVLEKVFSANNLPVRFHSHPTKGSNVVENIINQQLQTETSEQDRKESEYTHQRDGCNLLMPRGLIVGNGDLSKDIFIGLYNGFIAPVDFEKSKQKIREENIKQIGDAISSKTFNDNQKMLFGLGALLLLVAIIKYPKYSIPTIIGLAATASIFLTHTAKSDQPSYFNKLSFGEANIYIP